MKVQAIPTKYKGYEFKSRSEARWAVFFDAMEIRWEYEKEGYALSDGTWYLPDFWLPDMQSRSYGDKGIWLEVKGAFPSEAEQNKCQLFAKDLNTTIILVWDTVSSCPFEDFGMEENGMLNHDGYYEFTNRGRDNCMCFFTCYNCNKTKVEFYEGNYCYCPYCDEKADEKHPLLKNAILKAKNAKF